MWRGDKTAISRKKILGTKYEIFEFSKIHEVEAIFISKLVYIELAVKLGEKKSPLSPRKIEFPEHKRGIFLSLLHFFPRIIFGRSPRNNKLMSKRKRRKLDLSTFSHFLLPKKKSSISRIFLFLYFFGNRMPHWEVSVFPAIEFDRIIKEEEERGEKVFLCMALGRQLGLPKNELERERKKRKKKEGKENGCSFSFPFSALHFVLTEGGRKTAALALQVTKFDKYFDF